MGAQIIAAVTAALRHEIASDAAAQHAMQAWLIQSLAAQLSPLLRQAPQAPLVLARLSNHARFAELFGAEPARVRTTTAAITGGPATPAPQENRSSPFDNRGMQVGTLTQLAGDQYNQSAVAREGGTAIVFNGPTSDVTTSGSSVTAHTLAGGNITAGGDFTGGNATSTAAGAAGSAPPPNPIQTLLDEAAAAQDNATRSGNLDLAEDLHLAHAYLSAALSAAADPERRVPKLRQAHAALAEAARTAPHLAPLVALAAQILDNSEASA